MGHHELECSAVAMGSDLGCQEQMAARPGRLLLTWPPLVSQHAHPHAHTYTYEDFALVNDKCQRMDDQASTASSNDGGVPGVTATAVEEVRKYVCSRACVALRIGCKCARSCTFHPSLYCALDICAPSMWMGYDRTFPSRAQHRDVSKRSRQRQRAREALLQDTYDRLSSENTLLEAECYHLQQDHYKLAGSTFGSPFAVQYANAILDETQRLRLCIASEEARAKRHTAQQPWLCAPSHPRGSLVPSFPMMRSPFASNGSYVQPQQVQTRSTTEIPRNLYPSRDLPQSSSFHYEGRSFCPHAQPVNSWTTPGLPSLVQGSRPSSSLDALVSASSAVVRAASESGHARQRGRHSGDMHHHSLLHGQFRDEETEVGDVQVVDEEERPEAQGKRGESSSLRGPSVEDATRVKGKRGTRCKRTKRA
jgi:hypothetical protein